MLKTSPVLIGSANASPTNFRHAPSIRSPHSSPRQSTSISRRRSLRSPSSPNTSMNSSAQQRPRRPDAGPDDQGTNGASLAATPAQAPPPPAPQPMAANLSQHVDDAPPTDAAAPNNQTSTATNPPADGLSPNKRRGSPGPSNVNTTSPSTHPVEPSGPGTGVAPQAQKKSRHSERPPKALPQRYELCPVKDMVELIAHMVGELIATNDAIRVSNAGLTRFHSRTAPGISVRDYLHRLARHATLTPPLLLAMVYYIDRLCALYQDFTINTLTVHRFLITAATVSAKGLSDSFWNNTTYARIGGVRVAELKLLELELLYRVDWKIVPNPEVLVAYYKGLVERTPGYTLEDDNSDAEANDPQDGDGEMSDD